jgi:hypothetical protein
MLNLKSIAIATSNLIEPGPPERDSPSAVTWAVIAGLLIQQYD